MNKSVIEVNRLNMQNIKIPYLITGTIFLVMLAQDVVKALTAHNSGNMVEQSLISIGNLLWLLIPLAAIFVATKNFRRLINLGCRRGNFFAGSLTTYFILAVVISLANTLIFYTYDRFINSTGYFYGVINCLEVFGWSINGPVIACIQQFAFLFLVATVTHILALMQDNWVGWVVDLIIIAVIIVFTPIAFFNLIIFQSNAFLQIISCLTLAVGLYALSYPALSRKKI